MTNVSRVWLAVIVFLLVAIIAGVIVILSRYSPGQPVEITLTQPREWQGTISIDGAVNSPGSYPFHSKDTLESLIQAAGGSSTSSNLTSLQLYVGAHSAEPGISGTAGTSVQRININRADAKALEALPGIGEVLAQRIIDYRQTNGPFRTNADLIRVNGIGPVIYERVKDLITVGE